MTQVARPASDVSNANWEPTPLFPHIGNAAPNDGDPVAAPATPGGVFVAGLSPLAPPQAGTLTLTVRIKQTGPCPALATFALLQGGQVIAARSIQPTGTFTDYDLVLTQDEVDLISDYTNLQVRVLVGGGGSGSGSVCSGSWGCTPGSLAGSPSGLYSASGSGPSGSLSGSGSGSGPPGTCVGDCGYYGDITLTVSGCNCPGGGIDGAFPMTYQGVNFYGMLWWAAEVVANPCGQEGNMYYYMWYNPTTGCYIQGYGGICGPGDGDQDGTGTPGYVYSCSPLYIKWTWSGGGGQAACPGCGSPITVIATE